MITGLWKVVLLPAFLLTGGIPLSAQKKPVNTPKDYVSYPYWIRMMQDPHENFFETQKAFYTYWKGVKVTGESGYTIFKRWENYWQSRINQDGTFPEPDQVYREYSNYVQSHPIAAGFKTGQAVWQELGPRSRVDYSGGAVGLGRVNAVAFHPADTATIYAGAPNGGFWITHDGGRTWASSTDNLPTIGVSDILVNPVSPNVILMGTGDRDAGESTGLGVFRSEDGGLTWQPSNTGMGNVTVSMFARPESNLQMILAAAIGGIFKTIDGGVNWVKTSPDESSFQDITFRPGSTSIAYATSNNGFYRSENGGDTWTRVPNARGYPAGGRLVIGVTPANDSLVYLVGGENVGPFLGCFLSRDFGKTFSTRSTSPNIFGWEIDGSDIESQAYYDMTIHIDPVNPLVVYVGGVNIWKSVDGGKKWQIITNLPGYPDKIVHVDQHAFALNPLNNRLYIGCDGGVFYTVNQGTSWKNISEGLGIGQIYRIGVSSNDSKKTIAGFQDNGSATWTGDGWLTTGGSDGMDCAVDQNDNRYSYASSQNGPIYRFFNNFFERVIAAKDLNGINEDGAWTTPLVLSEKDGNTMVVGYKNIWISRNVKASGDITWTKISDNLAGRNDLYMYLLEQSTADENLFFAERYDGKIFRTENLLSPSVDWIDITARMPGTSVVYDFECHPYDPHTLYMIYGLKVYKSTNRGNSWQDISGSLPGIHKSCLVYDKTSNEGIYLGTDAGIFYKDADMTDWVMYGQSFPVSVGVTELEIYHDGRNRADSRLRASTFGRGVWEIKLAESGAVLPPALLTATAMDEEIDLNWAPLYYVQEYRIYRNDEFLTSVGDFTYTDTEVEPDVTYTYKVSAVYAAGAESGFSNEAFTTIVTPIELPYSQPFEKGNGGFSAKYSKEGWKYGTVETLGVTGREGHFFAANSASVVTGTSVSDYLTTPPIDLSSYKGKTITARFAFTFRKYRTYDKFSIHYRTAADSAWVKIADLVPPSKTAWVWDTTQFNLPEKALTEGMQIGFYYDNSNQVAWGAAVDDVELFVNSASILEIDNSLIFKVFPNPSPGIFTVELASGIPAELRFRIVNITGQLVFEKFIQNSSGKLTEKIDLSAQPKGVYLLTLCSGSTEWKQKITIQ